MNAMSTKPKSGNIVIRRMTSSSVWMNTLIAVLLLLTIIGFLTIDTKGIDLGKATKDTLRYFGIMFSSPRGVDTHFSTSGTLGVILEGVRLVGITLSLALLTTMVGGIISLFLSFFAASNLTNPQVGMVVKAVVALIRSVPTVLWVLIFAIGAGMGAVAAVIGMSFHTIGYLMKAYSETFEEMDHGIIEALKASGANWWQIIFQAVLPASSTALLGWTFMRFEINFAVAVAMGAAAGAGGIGFQLFMASGYYFDIREIGYITYLILAVALIMEFLATRMRNKLHIG